MVAIVCLRLAFGLVGSLVILDPKPIPQRFFRVHFLTALALLAVAAYFLHDTASPTLWLALAAAMLVCFVASIIWHLADAPGGHAINLLAACVVAACLPIARGPSDSLDVKYLRTDDLASGAVLGAATTAMLLGHSYLIAPAMTISPLLRVLGLFGIALLVRAVLACFGLWQWTGEHSLDNLETETLLWLAARWLLGLVAPCVLGWMAWETARIRSTQSATGILYVVVIVCFLGELTSLLLLEKTGSIL